MYYQQQLQDLIKHEHARYAEKIKQLEYDLTMLPEGHLSHHGSSYYHVIYKEGHRIQQNSLQDTSDSEQLVWDLKEKRHISKALPILKDNLKACDYFLNKYQILDMNKINDNLPVFYQDFDFNKMILDGDVYSKSWADTPYLKLDAFPEGLKHMSSKGLWVRSKAEALIATQLEEALLQFQYEPLEYFDGHQHAPDFKILHPTQRRFKYWEHLGLMDDPQYAKRAMEKIYIYGKAGIYAGDNLILTWETEKSPLTYEHVVSRIKQHFT